MIDFTTGVTVVILLLIAISILGINKKKAKQKSVIKQFLALGTIIQLKVYGEKTEEAIDEVVNKLNDIDDKMSVFKEYSEASRINENAGKLPQKVSKDTYFLLKKAVEYSELLKGTFDPTIRPLVDLWGIGTENAKIPSESEIINKLKLVDYRDIILNEEESSIKLKNEGQKIDFGGIAKGYAADEVRSILEKNKIKSALIDLGGNIFALGKKSDGTAWNIGIQNPFNTRGECVGVINAINKSVVTSGNYERYFLRDGKRFHHIIDPQTGYPSDSEIISATIVSDKSLDGDGLSTGIYIMGLNESMKLIESLKNIDAIFITESKKVYVTSGIKGNFKLINKEFILEDSI